MQREAPDHDAKLAAEIARLQAARGIQIGPWLRENKMFLLILAGYFMLVGVYAAVATARGQSPIAGAIIGVLVGPVVILRMYGRWRSSQS